MHERELRSHVELAAGGNLDALQRLIVHYHRALRARIARDIGALAGRQIDADDVLQQAYVAAFQTLAEGDPQPSRDRQGATDQSPDPEQNRDRQRAADQSPDRKGGVSSPPLFDNPGHFYRWLERVALNKLKNQQIALIRLKRDVRREVSAPLDTRTSYPALVEHVTAGDSTPSRKLAKDEAVAAVMSCLARLSPDQREVIRLRYLEGHSVPETAAQLGKSEPAIHALCYRAVKSLRALMVSLTHYLSRL